MLDYTIIERVDGGLDNAAYAPNSTSPGGNDDGALTQEFFVLHIGATNQYILGAGGESAKIRDILDGTSNTFLCIESAGASNSTQTGSRLRRRQIRPTSAHVLQILPVCRNFLEPECGHHTQLATAASEVLCAMGVRSVDRVSSM